MRNPVVIIILVVFLGIFSAAPYVLAQQKPVKLVTCDLKEDYQILGLVTYASGSTDITDVNDGLKKKASQMNADYVICVKYFSHAGMIYGYGTAIKTKVKKD